MYGANDLEEGKILEICRQLTDAAKEHWWIKPAVAEQFRQQGFHVLLENYYTPLPSSIDLAHIDYEKEYFPLSKLRFDSDEANALLIETLAFYDEIKDLPQLAADATQGFFWQNDQFSGLDAIAYYGLIRKLKPKTVIEIGAGFSSAIARLAIKANGHGRLIVIEPYPSEQLQAFDDIELIISKIQEVDLKLFQRLQDNDILFIDSSHCAFTQSDVHFEIFDIIPTLAPGVAVHFHDVFFPYEYPKPWIDAGWRWNEQYMLYALLLLNPAMEVLMPIFHFFKKQSMFVGTYIERAPEKHRYGQSLWCRMTKR